MKFVRQEKRNQGAPAHDLVYVLCEDNGDIVLRDERQKFATEIASPQVAAVQEPFRNSKITVRPAASTHNSKHKFQLVLRARQAEAQGAQSDVLELK